MENNDKDKENKDISDNISKASNETPCLDNPKMKVEWSPENELIMVEWCDVAQCYKWLNSKAHSKYSHMHAWFTIPAIIFSTISGTASFAQSSLPPSYQVYSPIAIGSINIFIGILTTIQQYLKISELNEAHRVSSIAWDKFARNIRIELSKHPNERADAKTFIKVCRQEFDRLMETSPDISESVIKEFNKNFIGKEGSKKRRRFEQLRKPDICDTIVSANETRHKWYKELENGNEVDDVDAELEDRETKIKMQAELLAEKEKELLAFNELENNKMEKQIASMRIEQENKEKTEKFQREQIKLIEKYITTFIELYERKPLKEEISNNIHDQIDEVVLNKYLSTYDNEIV